MYFGSTGVYILFLEAISLRTPKPFSAHRQKVSFAWPVLIRKWPSPDERELDNPRGERDTGKGLGLLSVRERAEFSGGSLDIDSAEGKGTIIRASRHLSRYRSEGTDQKVFYSSLGRVN